MAFYRPGDYVVIRIPGEGVALGRVLTVRGENFDQRSLGRRSFEIEMSYGLDGHRDEEGRLWVSEAGAEIGFV